MSREEHEAGRAAAPGMLPGDGAIALPTRTQGHGMRREVHDAGRIAAPACCLLMAPSRCLFAQGGGMRREVHDAGRIAAPGMLFGHCTIAFPARKGAA
ncbi:hypothetical protein [Corallococcus sp. CA049B]|uniref:hypothetical protein n=1 Tax=Corallococcus sp. CA049B TaxID=2316730 RepID=UPI0011C39AB7|nr:hypothetical protein [Corallococcus sp. CA049B]